MTVKTPLYGLEYMAQGEPIRATRQALENNAKTIEAALAAKGLAPPGTPDLAAAVARIGALEQLNAGGWVQFPIATPTYAHLATEPAYYRVEGRRVFCKGWVQVVSTATGTATGPSLGRIVSSPVPAALRPAAMFTTWAHWEQSPTVVRLQIGPDGYLSNYNTLSPSYLNLGVTSWPIG